MTPIQRALVRLADTIAPLAGPLLDRLPPRIRAAVFTSIGGIAATLGITASNDALAVVTVALWALGGLADWLVSWRRKQLAAVPPVTSSGPTGLRDIVIAVIACGGLVGCSHWHAGLQRAAIEASAAGQVEYLAGRGFEGSGAFAVETSATLKVCRDRSCVPITVAVETSDGAHVTVCASVWRLTTCEVVP